MAFIAYAKRLGDLTLGDITIGLVIALCAMGVIIAILALTASAAKAKSKTLPTRMINHAKIVNKEKRQAGNGYVVDFIVEDMDSGRRIEVTANREHTSLLTLAVGDIGELSYQDASGTRLLSVMNHFWPAGSAATSAKTAKVICPFCKKVYPAGTTRCEDCNAVIGAGK